MFAAVCRIADYLVICDLSSFLTALLCASTGSADCTSSNVLNDAKCSDLVAGIPQILVTVSDIRPELRDTFMYSAAPPAAFTDILVKCSSECMYFESCRKSAREIHNISPSP